MGAVESQEITVFATAPRTADVDSADFSAAQLRGFQQFRGVRLFLDVTAFGGTAPTLDVNLQHKDPESDKYFDLAGGASVAFLRNTGTNQQDDLTIYPGLTVLANRTVSDVIGLTWRIRVQIGGSAGQTFTFSLGAVLLP